MTLIRTVVIDDDREVAGIHTGFLLAHGGFDVVGVAYSGTEGLNLIASEQPELVLLDIHLPDMSGIDVLRATRNLPGEPVDVIAITAARELETVRAAMAGGVLHYLVKPFTSSVLLERLEQYVQHRQHILEHSSGQQLQLDQAKIDRLLGPWAESHEAGAEAGARGGGSGAGGVTTRTGMLAGVTPGAQRIASLPKGLSSSTLDTVYGDLRANPGGVSASEVANRLGLARVSARRYLEFLVLQRVATVAPRYGVAGRPEKIYSAIRR